MGMVLCLSIGLNIDRMNAYGSAPVTRARASSTSSIVDSAFLEKLAPVRISGPVEAGRGGHLERDGRTHAEPEHHVQRLTVASWAANRP